jgi:hypothetical protein
MLIVEAVDYGYNRDITDVNSVNMLWMNAVDKSG